jgi:hypothetical protein
MAPQRWVLDASQRTMWMVTVGCPERTRVGRAGWPRQAGLGSASPNYGLGRSVGDPAVAQDQNNRVEVLKLVLADVEKERDRLRDARASWTARLGPLLW